MPGADLDIHPEIRAALADGRPVVALESTLISHGLPYPQNVEAALALEAQVRAAGAVPATIAVLAGIPTVGLDQVGIEYIAQAGGVQKLTRRDLGPAVAQGRDGATTVAATVALAAAAGIAVFATGGIGGVHRGARESWDVSADLTELARTPVLVVCAGAKAMLDLPATLEYLETAGVPVVGYGTGELPAFYSRSSGLPLPWRLDTPGEVAATWRAHRLFGGPGGMLLAVPPPEETAIAPADLSGPIERALARAAAAGVRGPAITPFLLAAVAAETDGESIRTNRALLSNNARVAADVAVALCPPAPGGSPA